MTRPTNYQEPPMKSNPRQTLREIIEVTRQQAAERAWDRAKHASGIRHCAVRSGFHSTACHAARIKADAIRLVARLVPEQIRVSVDRHYHIGFLSIRLAGHGKLHLPRATSLKESFASPELVN
jgi:hypothetical protein